jgi:hypothetical protein
MWSYYAGVLERTWGALMSAYGTSTLGFWAFSIAVPVLTYALFVSGRWILLTRRGESSQVGAVARESLWTGVCTFAAVGLITAAGFVWMALRTVYLDNGLIRTATKQVRALEQELNVRKHTISTEDPVFPNLIYLLEAFRMYRNALGPQTKCTVYVTAPADSVPTASLVAQFQIAVSNCATAGPMGTDLPPSMQKEDLDGAVPGVVTVNAPENDGPADRLVGDLVHVFRVKRGYRSIPRGRLADTYPMEHYVWLQFGQNTSFQSEARQQQR